MYLLRFNFGTKKTFDSKSIKSRTGISGSQRTNSSGEG